MLTAAEIMDRVRGHARPAVWSIYCRNSRNPVSTVIRFADRWGQWSHCGVVTPGGQVLEATWPKGVVSTELHLFLRKYTAWHVKPIDVPFPHVGLDWGRSRIGEPYDTKAIFGNLFRSSWQEPGAWQCAEYLEMIVLQAGRARIEDAGWRISPNFSSKVV